MVLQVSMRFIVHAFCISAFITPSIYEAEICTIVLPWRCPF